MHYIIYDVTSFHPKVSHLGGTGVRKVSDGLGAQDPLLRAWGSISRSGQCSRFVLNP